MEICLHIGAHRTGSTSLQVLLGGQRQLLKRAGVAYWGPERTRTGLFTGLIKNPDTLILADAQLGTRSCGRMRMEFDRLAQAGAKQLIISEENMIGTMAQNLGSSRHYGQVWERLSRFGPAFEGQKLRIGIAMRAYDLHWASQLAYRIKAGMIVPTTADLDRLVTQPRRWRHVIADVSAALPQAQIVVWPFEGWIGNQQPLIEALLGRTIALNPSGIVEKSNASARAHELAQLVADRGDAEGAARLQAAKRGARYMPFDADQTLKLQDDYRADIAWLQAGADGRAIYLNPISPNSTEGTFGGPDMTKGSPHDQQERGVASAR